LLLFVFLVGLQTSYGFADTPYLGWSSWSLTGAHVPGYGGGWMNQDHIMEQSDAMKSKLQPHGYTYINLDSGWFGPVDNYGRPAPNTSKFSNITALSSHIHKNGQKFGLYWWPGMPIEAVTKNTPISKTNCRAKDIVVEPLTFASHFKNSYKINFTKPCVQEYYNSVAEAIHSYGADFVKVDAVAPGSEVAGFDNRDDIHALYQALKTYPIWLELSSSVEIEYATFWKENSNGWRVTGDIECYHCTTPALTEWSRVSGRFSVAPKWAKYAGPGGWNDFDSLDVGNGKMDGITDAERQTYATLWAISAVPMYTGDDLTKLDDYGLQLLANDEVIAINQAGKPALPVSEASPQQVWYVSSENVTVVALFNLGNEQASVTAKWSELKLKGDTYKVRDLWKSKDLGSFTNQYGSTLPSHGSQLLMLS